MGSTSVNPYTSQSISGYNSSPPPDDGTQAAANQLSWAKHKTKLSDPVKTLAEGINTAVSATFAKTINTDANVRNQISGSLALEWATATIGTDSISPTYSAVLLGTESGATSDTLQVITATGVYNGALLTIRQRNATEEITLIGATSTAATATGANLYLGGGGILRMDAPNASVLLQYDANVASGWVQVSSPSIQRAYGSISAATGGLSASAGISSVTKDTTGTFTIAWSPDFPNAEYSIMPVTKSNLSITPHITAKSAASAQITWRSATDGLANDRDFDIVAMWVP